MHFAAGRSHDYESALAEREFSGEGWGAGISMIVHDEELQVI